MTTDGPAPVIGIGICTVDNLFTVPHMPPIGGVVSAGQYLQQSGGLVGTALVTLARLGVATEMVGRIGDDEAGRFIRAEFEQEGVGVSSLLTEADAFSHVATVLVDENDGERTFIARTTTTSPLQVADISQAAIQSAGALFVDNINEVTLQAARWARDARVWTVLDPARNFEMMQPLLELIDVPIVPERFARAWLPDRPLQAAAERLVELGARIAVVTRGERGCIACWDEGLFAFPAFPIDVVDTTGAGDAFHGGFIYGLLQGWEVPDIVRFASAVGTLNCRRLGGRSGLPTVTETQAFIDRHGGMVEPQPI